MILPIPKDTRVIISLSYNLKLNKFNGRHYLFGGVVIMRAWLGRGT